MIRYTLVCDDGHGFEAWFSSSESYDEQAERRLVECPICGSTNVAKAMMAPALGRPVSEPAMPKVKTVSREETVNSLPLPVPHVPSTMAESERRLRALVRAVREHVTRTADNVGSQFPEEARRMHYGEVASRPIYGEASSAEVRALVEEGIDVAPLPILPDDLN